MHEIDGGSDDGGPSAEARRYLAGAEPSDQPIDFDDVERVREETARSYEPASRRAIDRHAIIQDQIVLGGVTCDRFRSAKPWPDTVQVRGTLFYLFGGGFIMGSPFEDLPIIGALAQWTGLTVIAPRYRLAPEHPAPAASDDALAAYRGLVAEGTVPLALAGESAGGNLALLTAHRVRDGDDPLPAVMALLSPAVDLRTDEELFQPTLNADPFLNHQLVHDVAAAYLGSLPANDPRVSPIFGSCHGLPPTIITTGSRDLLLSMCLRLTRRLARAGVDVQCRVWPGLWHVFEFYDEYPEQAESLTEIAKFIMSTIRPRHR